MQTAELISTNIDALVSTFYASSSSSSHRGGGGPEVDNPREIDGEMTEKSLKTGDDGWMVSKRMSAASSTAIRPKLLLEPPVPSVSTKVSATDADNTFAEFLFDDEDDWMERGRPVQRKPESISTEPQAVAVKNSVVRAAKSTTDRLSTASAFLSSPQYHSSTVSNQRNSSVVSQCNSINNRPKSVSENSPSKSPDSIFAVISPASNNNHYNSDATEKEKKTFLGSITYQHRGKIILL